MAPLPITDALLRGASRSPSFQRLYVRDVPFASITSTIIAITVFSTLAVLTMVFLAAKCWHCAARRWGRRPSPAKDVDTISESKPIDWARQDSNVLWSSWIGEDDLKAHFTFPPKSRLFSIGSVSTVDHGRCPLDRRPSHVDDVSRFKSEKLVRQDGTSKTSHVGAGNPHGQAGCEPASRPEALEARVQTKATSPPLKHRHCKSLEEPARRNFSAPGRHATIFGGT